MGLQIQFVGLQVQFVGLQVQSVRLFVLPALLHIVLTLKSVVNILAPLFKKRDVAAVAIPPNPPNTRHTCEHAKDCHYFFSNLCSSYSGDNYIHMGLSINDVTLWRGQGVVQNVTIVQIGYVNGTGT